MCLLPRQVHGFAMRIFALLYFRPQGVYGHGLPVLSCSARPDLPRRLPAPDQGRGIRKRRREAGGGEFFFDVCSWMIVPKNRKTIGPEE